MSLENALEEERISVMKLLEPSADIKKKSNHHYHHTNTSMISSINSQRKQSSSSMILDESTPMPPRKMSSSMLLDEHTPRLTFGNTLHPSRSSPYEGDGGSYRPHPLRPTKSSEVKNWSSLSPSTSNTPYAHKLAPSRSTDSPAFNQYNLGISPQTSGTSRDSRSRSHSRHRKADEGGMNFNYAFRRLSTSQLRKAGGALGDLYASEVAVEDDDSEEDSEDPTSGEYFYSGDRLDESDVSSDDSSDSDFDNDEDQSDDSEDMDLNGLNSRMINSSIATKSLMAAMEQERKSVESSKFRVKALLESPVPPGTARPPSMAEYAAYKRKVVHPATSYDEDDYQFSDENDPNIRDIEHITQKQKTLKETVGEIQSLPIGTKRMVRLITRGQASPQAARSKTYVLCSDLSPEAKYALEWTVGTLLKHNDTLYVAHTLKDELVAPSGKPNPAVTEKSQHQERYSFMTSHTHQVLKYLRRTNLEVNVIIEIIQTERPKEMMKQIVDWVKPDMIVVGWRGRGKMGGGSFSAFLVEHCGGTGSVISPTGLNSDKQLESNKKEAAGSTAQGGVPIMIVRRRLQKSKYRHANVHVEVDDKGGLLLESAKVD